MTFLMRASTIPAHLLLVIAAVCLTACRRGDTPAQAQSGPPPAGVHIVTLAPRPIEEASEYIATLRSQHSTTVQPEVEGLITQIFVKAGDRVKIGTPLIQINEERQRAAVLSAEANRTGTEADVEYWRAQVKRLQALVEAGAISRQEFDLANNSLRTAEARLTALDAQVREGRVQLQFYRVTVPQTGT